jgi:probable HAF family extracellular repeat protein
MRWTAFLEAIRPRPGRRIRAAQKRTASCLTVEQLEARDVPSYAVTDLGLTPGFASSRATALNQAGNVAGSETTTDGVSHAFLWHDGVLTDLGTLGGPSSYAYGVNDTDQVVGSSDTGAVDANGNAVFHAFLWQNGVMTDLGTLGGLNSAATGINNTGQIVGTAETAGPDPDTFIWQNGVMTGLAIPPVGLGGPAPCIDESGQVAGSTPTPGPSIEPAAYRWQAGTMTLLDSNPDISGWFDSLPTFADGINASGAVVGDAVVDVPVPGGLGNGTGGVAYTYYPTDRAALWQPDGYLTNLEALSDTGPSTATGINSAGVVVGSAADSAGVQHAVLWHGTAITDLMQLVPAGWVPDEARAINDAGQIAAHANGRVVLLTPVPDLTINNASVIEGNSGTVNAVFTVTLSTTSSVPVTVNYATADGTATAGGDYHPVSGTLTFGPGETTKTIIVPVNGDRLAEPNETFFVNLSGATSATVASGQGQGTIVDDEPRISISDVAKFEGKKGQTTLFTFMVTLSAAYDQPVTVSFRTADGTAQVSDNDYVSQTGALTFNPGETTKTITIVVKGDSKKEADETFFVDLVGNSLNSLLTKSRGVGTILNDD